MRFIAYIYKQRWGIETAIEVLKNKLECENFTGILPLLIEQDIQASVFVFDVPKGYSLVNFPIRTNALFDPSFLKFLTLPFHRLSLLAGGQVPTGRQIKPTYFNKSLLSLAEPSQLIEPYFDNSLNKIIAFPSTVTAFISFPDK